MSKLIYFAAPLFCQSEKDFNLQLTTKIEKLGFKVFLPQRDGFEFVELEGLSEEEKNQKIFQFDALQISKADIILAILDGRIPDEGMCIELGISWQQKKDKSKLIIGLRTDARAFFLDGAINPMVAGVFDKLFTSEAVLLNFLKDYEN